MPKVRFRRQRWASLAGAARQFAFATLGGIAISGSALAQAPAFTETGPLQSDTGYVLLGWEAQGPVTLSISRDEDFDAPDTVFHGSSESYFVSGLTSGDYYLRLADETGQQSEVIELHVGHQSLTQALWLTLIGLTITLAIVGTILRGARND